MYELVLRRNDPKNPSGTPTNEWLIAGFGALTLVYEIRRLRRWLITETLPADLRSAVNRTIDAFAKFLPEPQHAATEVKNQIEQISHLDPGPGRQERRAWARILGALEEIDVYLTHHPRLLKAD